MRMLVLMLAYSASQWTAFWAGVTAITTIGILLIAVWVGLSEKARSQAAQRADLRQRLMARRADAIEKAGYLYVEPLDRQSKRLAVRATGQYTYTGVRLQWFNGETLRDLTESSFTVSPNAPSISTAPLPENWNWPPRYSVTYSDAHGRRFAMSPDGRINLVLDPTESEGERELREGQVIPKSGRWTT